MATLKQNMQAKRLMMGQKTPSQSEELSEEQDEISGDDVEGNEDGKTSNRRKPGWRKLKSDQVTSFGTSDGLMVEDVDSGSASKKTSQSRFKKALKNRIDSAMSNQQKNKEILDRITKLENEI